MLLLAVADPRQQRIVQLAQVQEEVLRAADFEVRAAAILAARPDQRRGVVGATAIVALVAARAVVIAERADALDVTVGQPLGAIQAIELLHGVEIDVAVRQMRLEQILGHRPMILGVRLGEEVVADAQALKHGDDARMIAVDDLTRGDAFLFGADGDRRAVRVRAGEHEHVVAAHAVVARKDVRWQIGAGDVADVQIAVAIGPGGENQDLFGHERLRA